MLTKNIKFFFIVYISLFSLILIYGNTVSISYCQDNINQVEGIIMLPTYTEFTI
jgi:hypothetical protein